MEAFLYRTKLALTMGRPNPGSEAHGSRLGSRAGVKWAGTVWCGELADHWTRLFFSLHQIFKRKSGNSDLI